MTPLETAWLAGLLEGEGAFSLSKGTITVQLGMTDEDIVRKAGALVGNPQIGRHIYHNRTCKDNFRWTLCGSKAAIVMQEVLPLMGARRSLRIKELLAHHLTKRSYKVTVTACPHTDRKHFGRGFCQSCYMHYWYKLKDGDAQ